MVFYSVSSAIDKILLISSPANVFVFGDFNLHHKDWLTYSGGLIDLVNSVIIFLSQIILLRWLTFLLRSLTVTHSPVLLDFFLYSDTSICSKMNFPPLGNSDHAVVSVSADFLVNSKQDAPFHCIAYDYSCADWDGLWDHLRDVP